MKTKPLVAFDLDETLIHPGCLPLARNTLTGQTRELDSSMTEPLRLNEVYDYTKFECLDTLEDAWPCEFGLSFFNHIEPTNQIIIITARSSFTTY